MYAIQKYASCLDGKCRLRRTLKSTRDDSKIPSNRWPSGEKSMSSAGVDAILFQDLAMPPMVTTNDASDRSRAHHDRAATAAQPAPLLRRTPRKSIIVVLPDNHAVSPELVADRLPPEGDNEIVDVILACAGTPHSFAALQRRVRDLQVLLAPAGTSTEDLRELAMKRAPGDIVTLLCGSPICT
jgi:hypothetical protein